MYTHFVAPGAYSPEKSSLDKAPHQYSFGLKTIHEKQNENPGKCVSLHIRLLLFYNTPTKSMLHKIAPGAYQTENAPSKQQTPSYSFGVKVNHTKVSDTPCKFFRFFQIHLP